MAPGPADWRPARALVEAAELSLPLRSAVTRPSLRQGIEDEATVVPTFGYFQGEDTWQTAVTIYSPV